MQGHVCANMLLLLMMNFNIMENFLFPIFHEHKIQKQIILNLFSKEANFRVLQFPYLFNLPKVCPGLPRHLVDTLISNTVVLCRALLVLLFCVEPLCIDVIPLPQGDLGGQARHKPRFIGFSMGYVLEFFDPRRETDLVLFYGPMPPCALRHEWHGSPPGACQHSVP